MRRRCAASAKPLFKKLWEKFHRHLGTICTKAPDIFKTGSQRRAQIKCDIQSQHPPSLLPQLSQPGASLLLVSTYLPRVLAKGITWGLWIPHTFPAWLPVPAQSIATPSQLLLLFLAAGTEPGMWWVSWERAGCSFWYRYSFCLWSPIL